MKETEVKELLQSYSVCKKFLDSQTYAKEYFDPYEIQKIEKEEIYEARMHAIESLIQILAPSDEYTLLYLHHIKGISVEKCAECMCVSRRTAFRMLKKAYRSLCVFYEQGRSRQ